MATHDNSDLSIGEYLIRRLQDYGIRDVFGIPGDYILSFYTMLEESPLRIIGCTREDCAGFAADAYARVHGMGALCVTYCVGGLSVCNSVAGAYAEKSPVVMITGSPGLRERVHNPLLHHMVRDFRTQYDVFEKLCVAGTELADPLTAFSEIDRVLATCARYKRPVYIEIPRDMVHVRPEIVAALQAAGSCAATRERWPRRSTKPSSGSKTRGSPCCCSASKSIASACRKRPCDWPRNRAFRWPPRCSARASSPKRIRSTWACTKAALGRDEVTKYVEASDCVLMLGTFMTDINLGIYTAELDLGDCIYVTSEECRVRYHHYHDVQLGGFRARPCRPAPAAEEPAAARADRLRKGAVHAAARPSRSPSRG